MSIWTIIIILAIIIYLIIPSFKTRVLPVRKLIMLPAVFMYLLYQNIHDNFSHGNISLIIIVFGIMIGIGVGALMRLKQQIKADKKQQLILVPGSYISLILFILIFMAHFAVGYTQSVMPGYLLQQNMPELILLFLLTATSALTVGANLCLFSKYHLARSEELMIT